MFFYCFRKYFCADSLICKHIVIGVYYIKEQNVKHDPDMYVPW